MIILKKFLFMKPDDGGSTGGGAADRGDDFEPTDSDAVEKPAPVVMPEPVLSEDDKKLAKDLKGEEAEAEPEAEAEEAEDDEEKAEDKPKKKGDSRIPLARHKEILEKERAERKVLEQQLAQFQHGQKVADIGAELTTAETQVLTLEKEYAKLLTDGETDKAVETMSKIRALERQITESKSDLKISAAVAQATEQARYNVALERIEEAYPQLNPDHEDYDAELMTDVADMKAMYERRGMTPTAAMQQAVTRLTKATTVKQENAVEVTPQVKKEDIAVERKKAAVAKTLKAVNSQPPSLGKVGMDSDKDGGGLDAKSVTKMSFKDFSNLSDEQLAALRGDSL